MGQAAPPSIGRFHERARLEARLEEARAGQPRVVLVTGEPGIGKTALARDLGEVATRARCRVLTARCIEGLELPYAPLGGSVFPEIRSHLPRWSRETPALQALMQFLDAWPAPPPRDPGEADGMRMRLLLGDALLRLAVDQPLVVVVDDLHWSDRSTADLLMQVALRANDRAALEPVPLLLVATFREAELGPIETNVARLRREPSCSTLELRGLDRVETGLLLDRSGTAPMPPAALTTVHQLSRGNPLFIEALARSMADDPASAADGTNLPYEVRGFVDDVVALLDDAGREVLRTAAVLGDVFSRRQLDAVLDRPSGEVDQALEAAAQRGLIRWTDAGTVEFAHPLYSETLRRGLSARQRCSMHAQIAARLARGPDLASVAVIASHWIGAGSEADGAMALPTLVAAAQQAERLFAWDEAAQFLEAALALCPRDPAAPDAVDLEHRLGVACLYSGDAAKGLEHLRAARIAAEAVGSTVDSARILVDELHCEAIARRTGLDLTTDFESRFVEVEPLDPSTACRGLAELAQYRWVAFDFEGGERLAHRALEMALRHDAHAAHESAQRSLAMIDWRHARVVSSRQRLLDARTHGRASGDRKLEVGSGSRLPLAMIWCGDVDGARGAVDDAIRIIRETNYFVEEGFVLLARAYLAVVAGAFGDAIEQLVGVFLLERITGYSWASALARALFARVHTLRGRWDDARLAIEEWDATSGVAQRARSAEALEALVLAGTGRSRDAGAWLVEQAPGVDDSWRVIGDDSAAATLVEVADVTGARIRLTEALTLLQSLEADGQVFTCTFLQLIPRVVGDALLVEGRVAEAGEQLRRALAIAVDIGARPEMARCQYSLARVHLDAENHAEAERLLKEAARLAQELGLDLVHRIEATAGRAGLSLGAPTSVGPANNPTDDVVVMFVDIVDSTRLTYEYGDEQFRVIALRLDRMLRQAIDRHGGTVIEATNVGDGLLMDIGSPEQALACAVECIDVATTVGLGLHVGLNLGPVVRERNNIFGTTVNVAARVTAQSGTNEIFVTEAVVERSGRPLRCFADRGLQELKGIPDAVRLFLYTP